MTHVLGRQPRRSARSTVRALGPGLSIAAAGCVLAKLVSARTGVSVLFASILIGVAVSFLPPRASVWASEGLHVAARRLLRAGVVLLGFRLAVGDVLKLGPGRLALVFIVVVATLAGTCWVGRRLAMSRGLSTLMAVGFAICGASAILAASAVTDADDDDVALSIVLVTLFGTLAVLFLPPLGHALGLDDRVFGTWVGASVHDVGQVVAAASTRGPTAVRYAVVVKLCRVALLAPVVAALGWLHRRDRDRDGDPSHPDGASPRTRRPPLVPLFVAGFFAAALIRSTGVLSARLVADLQQLETVALSTALVGLGAGFDLARSRRAGVRPLALGLIAWVFIAGLALAGSVI